MTTGKTKQPQRRGVILLLVLAVMAMFAMLIATFLVVSSQQYRQSQSMQKLDRYVQSPEEDLHATALQLLVGSNTRSSVIRAHNLAATEFGDVQAYTGTSDDTLKGIVTSYDGSLPNKPELHQFTLRFDVNPDLWKFMATSGSVFTIKNPLTNKWHSARIVDAYYDSGYFVEVRDFPNVLNPAIFNNCEFYINPPAFAGTGVGYVDLEYDDGTNPNFWKTYWNNYTMPRLMAVDVDNFPFAHQLNPNAPVILTSDLQPNDSVTQFGLRLDDGIWQLNVDYTAPDAANPFLGWFDLQFNNGVFDPATSIIIPSYHRPSLIKYYNYPTDPDVLRKLVMRPLPFDHREFDGSNPPLGTTNISDLAARLSDSHGLYLDVDTDGDGIKDAVWVDVGLPVRTDLNGRTYKPLVAIKCVDLDGRLNVNTHGNLAEIIGTNKVGSGFGPAGVNLTRGFEALLGNSQYALDITGPVLERRYAGKNENVPRSSDANALTLSVRTQFSDLPIATPLYNFFGNLPDYWDQGFLTFDPLGNRFSNFAARSFEPFSMTEGAANGYWDLLTGLDSMNTVHSINPYLFDPNRRTPYDQPFTLSELEAVLRQNDIDKDMLPGRLRSILGVNDTNGNPTEPNILKVAAHHTTTLSNDVPVPGPALADQGYASLYELIRACVQKEASRNGVTVNVDNITLQLIKFLPDEIKQGGKINLNKLVEDPAMFLADLASTWQNNPDNVNYEKDYYKAINERSRMARGIYLILMALSYDKLYGVHASNSMPNAPVFIVEPYIEPSFLNDKEIKTLYEQFKPLELSGIKLEDDQTTYAAQLQEKADYFDICRELAATRLAQWSVNVIDFIDTDAAMTPLVFDVNPFEDKGLVVGDFEYETHAQLLTSMNNSATRLVWGMEKSDLLITETVAWHDLRQGDTDQKESGKTHGKITDWVAAGADLDTRLNYDRHYDQIAIPRGNAFMEFQCVTNPNQPSRPSELYFHDGNDWRLDLAKMTPQLRPAPTGSASKNITIDFDQIPYPVWRVTVGESTAPNGNSSNTAAHVDNNVIRRLIESPDRFSVQPKQFRTAPVNAPTGWSALQNTDSVLGRGDTNSSEINIDRIVWFNGQYDFKYVSSTVNGSSTVSLSGPLPFHHADFNRIYFNHYATGTALLPNDYLVVGSRRQASVGSLKRTAAYGSPSSQQFVMRSITPANANSTEIDFISLNNEGYAFNMVAATFPPLPQASIDAFAWGNDSTYLNNQSNWETGWDLDNTWLGLLNLPSGMGDAGNGIGFSISEPLPQVDYYDAPTHGNSAMPINASRFLKEAYGDLTSNSSGTSKALPFERPDQSRANRPIEADNLVFANATVQMYKTAFLQRVADPNRPYHPITNPYLTVDWNMFDLSVFNSEGDDVELNYFAAQDDHHNELDNGLASSLFSSTLASRQWGMEDLLPSSDPVGSSGSPRSENAIIFPKNPNPWGRLIYVPGTPSTIPSGNNLLDYGRITRSTSVGVITDATITRISQKFQGTLGYLNQMAYGNKDTVVSPDTSGTGIYYGAPTQSFQHLPWHNGPLANSLEVMQVPASAPGRFGVEFSDPGTLKSNEPPYDTNYLLPEDHLGLNFDDPLTSTLKDQEKWPGSLGSNVRFGHLLNFQHSHGSWWQQWYTDRYDPVATPPVVPPFVSLDLANALNFLSVPSRFVGTRDWYYDSNKNKWYNYSRFQEPGKINLNTMTGPELAALLENREFFGDTFAPSVYDQFDFVRGNNRTYDAMELFLFEAPFRSSSSALLNAGALYESAADATLLRSAQKGSQQVPVFAPPIDKVTQNNAYSSDNSYTALEGIQRLSDMTTTRSNVFAVWMTLGYFEVEKINASHLPLPNGITSLNDPSFNAIYPDGYTLKKEVGLETGEIKRHRAFYIIDRSVPFGYRRGMKLNSEDAILLKHFIE